MGIFGRKKHKGKSSIIQAADATANSHAPKQYVELGTIDYVNLTIDRKHGDYQTAIDIATETGKPIFCNFVEWAGWQGCKDAGRIFADPNVKKAAEELFVPCAFNT